MKLGSIFKENDILCSAEFFFCPHFFQLVIEYKKLVFIDCKKN